MVDDELGWRGCMIMLAGKLAMQNPEIHGIITFYLSEALD
jgi:hypothetical protein